MTATELKKLNQEYGIRDQLVFTEGPGGLTVAEIRNPQGEATVALHGGHILSFRPHNHEPVLWLSRNSYFTIGKAIRGGIPVCWPWFADHATYTTKPAHGFVRTAVWSVSETEKLADESTRLKLSIVDNEETIKLWSHRFRLELECTVSNHLKTKLIATNTGHKSFICGGALHSYFKVSAVSNIHIKGLEGCSYVDKVDRGRRKVQNGPVSVSSETDRIYLDTKADCIIEDSGLQRKICISKTGSRTTVVWNSWIEKAKNMKDFGDSEYRNMACVETANADTDVISLSPGHTHTLESVIRVERLADRNELRD